MSDKKEQGAELSILSKLLFDKATLFWYIAILIEILAGIFAVVMSILKLADDQNIFAAIFGFCLLSLSYYLKIRFETIYNNAETMRRQAVFTEALGWEIGKTQFSIWRQLAGHKILKKSENQVRPADYFASQEPVGLRRLIEMTQESAFWTRHLYGYAIQYLCLIFIASLIFFYLVITFAATDLLSKGLALKIVYSVYLLLPLILSMDILGWILRLNRLKGAIQAVENDLERIEKEKNLNEGKILRIVSEYNCQLVAGFPIPGVFFRFYHNPIEAFWKKRNN